MDNINQVNEILMELNSNPKVITSFVVLKSGMLAAGQPPTGVHMETFVTMMSILLSAAESATSGLRGKLENVFVEMNGSRLIIDSVGKKGVLVVVTNTKDNHDSLYSQIKKAAQNFASVM
jgi:predicted regulator of Ras-like GTPase activity (Roadblock/LC7/MglB family)